MKLKNLYREQNLLLFVLDLFMLGLVSLNFLLIIANWTFSSHVVNEFLAANTPEFHDFFDRHVHKPFLFYDLIFVAIYATEVTIRWAWAIYDKTYERWYFYPFVHWYDVLGCVPVDSFRILRFLRFFSVMYRLQKFEVVDFTRTQLYRLVVRGVDIVVEEVSDRVVVNVLSSVQREVQAGSPVTDKLVAEVIRPQKAEITDWITQRIQHVAAESHEKHREAIKSYLYQRVTESVDRNREVSLIDRFPLVGPVMTNMLEEAVADIVFKVIDGILSDLANNPRNILVDEISDASFEALLLIDQDQELNRIVTEIIMNSIEEVKDHVKIQQWKLKYMKQKPMEDEKENKVEA